MHNSSKIALILSCTPYFGPRKFILALENSINFNELIENPKSFRKQLALRDISIDYLTEKKYLTYLDKANKFYPSNNRKLHSQIATNGLIISEFQLRVGPLRHNFPLRNRIISGLSKGVLVVEAAAKSGSLITANLALEQNKDVFAVPGSIFNITSEGCNTLISQGAKVVTSAKDIVSELCANELPHQKDIFSNIQTNNLSEQEKLVFDSIDSKLTTIDNIINSTKLNYSEITQILFELEMQNLIQSAPGGYTK